MTQELALNILAQYIFENDLPQNDVVVLRYYNNDKKIFEEVSFIKLLKIAYKL